GRGKRRDDGPAERRRRPFGFLHFPLLEACVDELDGASGRVQIACRVTGAREDASCGAARGKRAAQPCTDYIPAVNPYRPAPHAGRASGEVTPEELDRAPPGELGRPGVVAGRGVVVEAVAGAGIDVD